MSSIFSADTDDLDGFVNSGDDLQRSLTSMGETLARQRNYLLGAGFPKVVEHSQLGALENSLVLMADLDRFVGDISISLKLFGADVGHGVYEAPVGLTRARLDGTEDQRLDDLEAALISAGIDPAEAEWIRQRVEAAVADDPRFEIDGATASESSDLAAAIIGLADDRAADLVDRNATVSGSRNRQARLSVAGLAEDLFYQGPADGFVPPGLLDRALHDAIGDERHVELEGELATLTQHQSIANWSLVADADGPIELGGDLDALRLAAAELFDDSHSSGGRGRSRHLDEAELAYQMQVLADEDPARAVGLKWILEPMLSPGQRADLDRILATNGDFGEGIGLTVAHPVDGASGAGKGFWNSNFGWLADGWADATTAITYGFYGIATNSAPGVSPEVRRVIPHLPETWEDIDSVVELEFELENIAEQGGADLTFLAEVASAVYSGGKGGLSLVRAGRRYFLRSGPDIVAEVGPDLARQLDDVPTRPPPHPTVYRVQGGTPPRASYERIAIGPSGNLEVSGETRLYVTFDDLGRSKAYVTTNRPGANIVAFDVDPAFVDDVRAAAVRQSKGLEFPDAPQVADATRTSGSFGLPAKWIIRLEDAAIPGTGRIIEP